MLFRSNTNADYPAWATQDYKNYGYADKIDFLLLGAYASANSIYGNGEWTVQGFCKNAKKLLLDDVEFAGGPDVGNGTGWTEGGQSARVIQSVDAAISEGNGYFVFDIVHVKMYNYWDALKEGIDNYLKTINN